MNETGDKLHSNEVDKKEALAIAKTLLVTTEGKTVRLIDACEYVLQLIEQKDKPTKNDLEVLHKLAEFIANIVDRGNKVEYQDFREYAKLVMDIKKGAGIEVDPDEVYKFTEVKKLDELYDNSPNTEPVIRNEE